MSISRGLLDAMAQMFDNPDKPDAPRIVLDIAEGR